jgi:nucleoside-diphosphate-sugar epimerase
MDAFHIPENVLITGARGFLGKHIREQFEQTGWKVSALGLSKENDFSIDLSLEEPILDQVSFQRVIHIAGLAHKVAQVNDAVQSFYNVNLGGTNHLLSALTPQTAEIKQFVYISTVAVYGREAGHLLTEETPLEGRGPYVQSKMQAEEQVLNWGNQYGVPVLILRLPFVAGENAPGEFGKILQLMRSPGFRIMGKGNARRSAVRIVDLAEHLLRWEGKDGIYNLTDGYHPSFCEWYDLANQERMPNQKRKHLPDWAARILSGMGDLIPGFPYHSRLYYLLSSELTYSDEKARRDLGWNPVPLITP